MSDHGGEPRERDRDQTGPVAGAPGSLYQHPETELILRRLVDVVGSARPMPLSASVMIARDEVLEMMLDVRPAGIRPMITAFATADLRDVLPTITVPTLLLSGALDVRSPLSVAEELHQHIPRSELVVLADVGHVTNIEAPAAFDATVRAFLRTVTA